MRNTIYICSFKKNDLLNESFDFREEAINWAKEHIAAEPIVEAVDLEYSEEFGAEPEIYEREEIFRYPEEISDEKEKISKDEEDSILAELEKYADKIDAEGDKLHRDHPELESLKESSIESEIESVAANWGDVQESLKEEADPIEEDVILFDPFGCDFSECEPMEVCKDEHRADCCDNICASPADFLRELAAELGIADEVEISEKECADDSCEEKHEDEIPCDNCENEISEISDKAKDPEDVVPEEVKANEEPNVEVQVEDEKPAEEISKCHVCPECGKEICEDAKQLDEAYRNYHVLDADGNELYERESDMRQALLNLQNDENAYSIERSFSPEDKEDVPDGFENVAIKNEDGKIVLYRSALSDTEYD